MKLPSELTRIKVILRPFIVHRYFRTQSTPKLHLGCAGNVVPGWLNGDKFDSRADIFINVYRRFPFPDDSFQFIYCEHLIEHLAIHRVRHFLLESLRVLKPGGVFRLSLPDLELLARKYLEHDDSFWQPWIAKYRQEGRRPDGKTWIVRTNGAAFMSLGNLRFFHHRWMYDFDTIRACSEEVGFSRVLKQQFRQGLVEELANMDRPRWEPVSLYVELVKGASAHSG